MERQGHKVFGIRLDSGDLSWLSKEARRLLDDAGLNYVKILASNQLNEYKIGAHERDGSMIDIYAPGTELATGGKDSALGGVLKLVAIEDENGVLQDRIKLSSDTVKITIPGMQEVARYSDTAGKFVGDCIYDPRVSRAGDDRLIVNPADLIQSKRIPDDYRFHDLLKPASYAGVVQGGIPSFDEVRARVKSQVASLDKSVRRIEEPHPYPAGISPELDSRIRGMIIAERSR